MSKNEIILPEIDEIRPKMRQNRLFSPYFYTFSQKNERILIVFAMFDRFFSSKITFDHCFSVVEVQTPSNSNYDLRSANIVYKLNLNVKVVNFEHLIEKKHYLPAQA